MRIVLAVLLFTTPALAEAPGERRTAPEASDVALFVVAAGAVWLTRRALRRRALPKD
ncbi:hypothetical protein [Sphingomonas sp. Leaf412]|uniref:hypothetical protein n=1 Tax=Sphingomonas sp. Leaf412 TaxID=1736370 RepID=UPI000B05DBCA|nr:hypothetical protein [Sphingomonas sp. Leaf412]